MASTSAFERGSEWRQWDLHIHTPASFHWKGGKFDADPNSTHNRALVDQMIAALNAATPTVFALMDYWTFDGWFALQRRLKEKGAPQLNKTVFPGIELRLMAPMSTPGKRLNAHVLFSDQTPDQTLHDFKSMLRIAETSSALSDAGLIGLARTTAEDNLTAKGFKKADMTDAAQALYAGASMAELTADSYREAIAHVKDGLAIGFMPFDTSDGLKEVKWQDHYAYFIGLFKSSPIFESRNLELRDCFINEQTDKNKAFLKKFQERLGSIPRLVVSGSDAHCFVGVKDDNDKRGYGDFPSGKITWIKADPTFLGLQQAIMEPAKRSFIGDRPPKQVEIEANKTYYIDHIEVTKHVAGAPGIWLDDTTVPLNSDLVAIIGNKGSGKSALADVIALLGNSRQKLHFSFLKKDRFRGKNGEPAKNFTGKLTWIDGKSETRTLSDDPAADKVEMVRYIPQGHFEDLCNAHISGSSNAFEQELRSVIFSHTSDEIRLGAHDFGQLIEQQEDSFRIQLNDFRKDLHRINAEIAVFEEQLQPNVKSSVQELLSAKNHQIAEHNKIRPTVGSKPAEALTPEQQTAATRLEAIATELKTLETDAAKETATSLALAGKVKAIQNVRERLKVLGRAHQQFLVDADKDLALLGLAADAVVTFTVKDDALQAVADAIPDQQQKLKANSEAAAAQKIKLDEERQVLNANLNGPQLQYQQDLAALEQWNQKLAELTGSAETPEAQLGLMARIKQLEELPKRLAEHQAMRVNLTGDIFDVLESQRKARETLFKPVQDLIQGDELIREEYKLQFQASLSGSADSIGTDLFDLIKQTSGELRGKDEGTVLIRGMADRCDFNSRKDVLTFVEDLHKAVAQAASASGKTTIGLGSILKKDKAAVDVYDLLFGLLFLEPRYSLLFQDTKIEQLSPGQRGALLLIFYLLVDKGRNPIILDQPEENLDNETVYNLLVPVLTKAKRLRQIIMVTHNPNLAVVCDSEQLIWSTFDRKNGSKISYLSGAIENPAINGHVVDVLEGTMPAFNNRGNKYHPKSA
jgi:ABC-type lipoprotein export system ATPase subunit